MRAREGAGQDLDGVEVEVGAALVAVRPRGRGTPPHADAVRGPAHLDHLHAHLRVSVSVSVEMKGLRDLKDLTIHDVHRIGESESECECDSVCVGERDVGQHLRLSLLAVARVHLPEAAREEHRLHLGFTVYGLGFRVQGLVFSVQCSGFRVWGLGFRV